MNQDNFFDFPTLFTFCAHIMVSGNTLQVEAIKQTSNNSVVFWNPAEINSTLDKHKEPNLGILEKQHRRCQTETVKKNYNGNYRVRLLWRTGVY